MHVWNMGQFVYITLTNISLYRFIYNSYNKITGNSLDIII
jgi:hypothetical protein